MYYEVYVDVLFVENLWMNAMLLILTAWAGQMPARGFRIAAAACTGSLGACVLTIISVQLSGIAYFLGTFILAVCIIVIAFWGEGHFWISLFFLYLEGFVLNGILRYLEQFHPLSGVWFGVFSGGSVVVLLAAERFLRRRRSKKEMLCQAVLQCGDCRMLVAALWDTGNGLYDPVSRKPVSILAGELMEDFLNQSGRELLPRMIPYHTISENGLLEAYTLDSMEIQYDSGKRVVERPLVACMPQRSGQYQLILHRDLLSS